MNHTGIRLPIGSHCKYRQEQAALFHEMCSAVGKIRCTFGQTMHISPTAACLIFCYRMRIGNHTSFQMGCFQRPSVTSNSDFKVTILFNVKLTRKWYKICLYLQWLPIGSRIPVWFIKQCYFQWYWTTQTQVSGFNVEYLGNGMRYRHTYKC